MDYTGVFKNSGQTIWRYKPLWLLGLLLISSSFPGLLIVHLYMRFVFSIPNRLFTALEPEEFFQPILDVLLNPVVVIGAAIGFLLVFTIVWMISTIGEAALIRSVADYADGRSHSFREMLSIGSRLLVRIIAIDTVIFLPLFLILLAILLIIGGGLIGGILQLAQAGTTPDDLGPIFLVVALLVMFLIALAVPVMILTLMFRVVAFRSAVLEDLPTRPSIRRAWALIRAKLGQIIVVVLLLYAVSYAVGMITSLLVLPFSFGGMFLMMQSFMAGPGPQFGNFDGFVTLITAASVIGIFPRMVYQVFSSAVWTMTYREWQHES